MIDRLALQKFGKVVKRVEQCLGSPKDEPAPDDYLSLALFTHETGLARIRVAATNAVQPRRGWAAQIFQAVFSGISAYLLILMQRTVNRAAWARRILTPILLLSLVLGPAMPTLAQPPKSPEVPYFIQDLLEQARATGMECPQAIRDAQLSETVVCADYRAHFSAFKSDCESFLDRFEYRTAESKGPWHLEGGVYKRQYDFEGTMFTIGYSRDNQLIWVSYTEPDPESGLSVD